MASRRPNATVSQVLIACAVLLVPVVLIYLWFSRVPDPTPRPVDWQPVVTLAKTEAPYPVAVPENLPEGWTVVRARWTPAGEPGLNQQPAVGDTLQLGYLTPDQVYLGLDQRNTDPKGLIAAASRATTADGESELAGVSWQRYVSDDRRSRALVRSDEQSTLVISGDLPYEALEAFAGTLA
ncbi:DUF4245 domain-containing protein [Micropruina sonneratiae]|uniref:DUF4245 domain-containing protein n=1 Tax=Micropruina sonneratiae TaxID=2986940 RepID=UPI002226E712|nr:DUF4245 domain-containing protein [Micropruina sp. KQZ13P-5]MCW3156687.1 DUF4245 domain-containing protein [Micropruina sp. KQZ13P-5]